jgi:hypothetical protein
MSAPDRRMSEGAFWDMVFGQAINGLADSRWKDGGQYVPETVAARAGCIADAAVAERRKRPMAEGEP